MKQDTFGIIADIKQIKALAKEIELELPGIELLDYINKQTNKFLDKILSQHLNDEALLVSTAIGEIDGT